MIAPAFVCIDTETTGLKPDRDRLIEVGLVRVEGDQIVGEFRSLINPKLALPAIITEITGITDEDLAEAPAFQEIAPEIAELLNGALFVAHNAEFDYGFLKHEFARIGEDLTLSRLCTVRLSRMLFPEHRRHDLSSIIERYNFPIANRHRAFDDALIVWKLLEHMKANLSGDEISRAVARVQIG